MIKVDPYAITDKWLPFHFEDDYITYLKCQIWHTDGQSVKLISSYKETPSPKELPNGNYSSYWMISDRYTLENPPPLPPMEYII